MSQTPSPTAAPQVSDHVATLWVNRWIVLAIVGVFMLGAFGYAQMQETTYSASADVLVGAATLGTSGPSLDLDTETDIANSLAVAQVAYDSLTPRVDSVQAVHKALSVRPVSAGRVLTFTFHGSTAKLAEAGAKASAAAYLSYRGSQIDAALNDQRDRLKGVLDYLDGQQNGLERTMASNPKDSPAWVAARGDLDAVLAHKDEVGRQLADNGAANRTAGTLVGTVSPAKATSPSVVALMTAAALMGLLLGGTIAFGLEGIRGRVRGSHEIEDVFGAPVLGVVPMVRDAPRDDPRKALEMETDSESPVAEAFRVLRSSVLRLSGEDARVLLVTSGAAGEGKSTTAANLAVRIAGSGKQVLLVDADLRRPSLHRYFGIGNRNGLRHLLQDGTRGLPISITGIAGLAVIAAGPATAASADHFEAGSFRAVIDRLRPLADYIVIDAPPVFVSDTVLMAPVVDGIVFVADAQKTTQRSLARSRDLLDRLGLRATGIVLNKYQGGPGSEFGYRPYRYEKKEGRSPAAVDVEGGRPKRGTRRTRGRGDDSPGLREAIS